MYVVFWRVIFPPVRCDLRDKKDVQCLFIIQTGYTKFTDRQFRYAKNSNNQVFAISKIEIQRHLMKYKVMKRRFDRNP